MTQHSSAFSTKPGVRILDPRSYSQNRQPTTTFSPYSPIQNAQQLSNSKTTKQPPSLPSAYKPLPTLQSLQQTYKQKLQDLQSRLGEQNQYLRQTTQGALKKLQNANLAINRIKKEKEEVEKENVRLVNQLERKNGTAKEFMEITERLRKENAGLNMKIGDMMGVIEGLKEREGKLKEEMSRGYSERELKDKVEELNGGSRLLNKQKDLVDMRRYDKDSSRERSPHLLQPPENLKQPHLSSSHSPSPSQPPRQNFILSQKPSIDKLSHNSHYSRDNSLNNSKRSSKDRSNFLSPQLSPKQSARMEILFEEIGIIRKNLAVGGRMSQSIGNKLFSLINHLTNALNKRNDQNLELKKKVKQYEQMIIDNHWNREHNEINFTFQTEEVSPVNNYQSIDRVRGDKYSARSIDRPRSSFDAYLPTPPSTNQSFQLSKPTPYNRTPTPTTQLPPPRNQSLELKSKYNFVYRKIDLSDYLKNKIEMVTSMELVTKITEIVEKNLLPHPKVLSASDFYVLYCDGECPSNLKTRVELKQAKNEVNVISVSELKMMESLGYIFENILKSVKLMSFEEEKLFEKSVKPAFVSIINNLKSEEKERLSMEKFKLLLHRLKY